MSTLADHTISIATNYEARLVEIQSFRNLIRSLASDPLYIVRHSRYLGPSL